MGQRFVKADYYELDWYYEECTDGKTSTLFHILFMSQEVTHYETGHQIEYAVVSQTDWRC